jgi:hypothetical protein
VITLHEAKTFCYDAEKKITLVETKIFYYDVNRYKVLQKKNHCNGYKKKTVVDGK